MKLLDTPIRPAAGRTLREILLIGAGVASVGAAVRIGDQTWNVYVYAAATVLFAIRFYAARVLYLSWCVGALALQLSCLMLPGVTLAQVAPALLGCLGCALLLSGGDLVRRFDDAGRGIGPMRNFWQDLSLGQRRHIAWGMHLVGATSGLLHHMWFNVAATGAQVPGWLYAGIAAAMVIGALYLSGRALAAPATFALGVAIAVKLAPHLGGAWGQLHGRWTALPPEIAMSAHYAVTALVCAVGCAAIALPWTVRWLRLPWR
jgi:hypothetical protein